MSEDTHTGPEAELVDVEPVPPADDGLGAAAEVHARVTMALDAAADAAELAGTAGALPELVARSVMRALSQAHRHLADAHTASTPEAVAMARLAASVTRPPEDVGRRVICACGLTFTPASWELHRDGQAEPERHTANGQLVPIGPAGRRRAVDVLLGGPPDEERGRGK